MWNATLPPEHLRAAIKQVVSVSPVTFAQLVRILPQLRGTEDLAVNSGFILWRGVSDAGVTALRSLHAEGAIFFWLCPPSTYAAADDAPLLRLMSSAQRPGEDAWLPTLIFNRPPSASESRKAVKDYVAELSRTRLTPSIR
jgi:hypothetical protein